MDTPKAVVVPRELYYHEVAYVRGLEAKVAELVAALEGLLARYGIHSNGDIKFAADALAKAKGREVEGQRTGHAGTAREAPRSPALTPSVAGEQVDAPAPQMLTPADNASYLTMVRASAIEQRGKNTYTWMDPSHVLSLLDLIDAQHTALRQARAKAKGTK